ncbi:MAG: DUF983 domain-containing protein [Phototrophicaceae bacterium]|jgi:uncharacterized protein (DUF983 family)
MNTLHPLQTQLHKLWISGVRLRCPNCERGHIVTGLFAFQPTCEQCGVRYERLDGESLGGLVFTAGAIPTVAILGFFLTNWLTAWGIWWNAALWLGFIAVACLLGYRHARAAWVGVSWLTGGVYNDT